MFKGNKENFNAEGSSKKSQREPLTPYKIAVIKLIKIYCDDKQKDVAERHDFCVAALKLIQSPDMDIETLLEILFLKQFRLERFANELQVHLNELYKKGIGELFELFETFSNMMKLTTDQSSSLGLNRNSVLGHYIRRMIVLFESLTFYETITLYDDLKTYISDENKTIGSPYSFGKEHFFPKSRDAWRGRQAELIVAQQAHALQTDEEKALPPKKLQELVESLLHCSPFYSEAYYLSYLNYLRVNEYSGAVESLYHCFDRILLMENRSNPASNDDKSKMFRYAALNLASLHIQFNHKKSAIKALKEAIKMGQEFGDNVCLQLAHAWKYYLENKNKGSLIDRSIGRANILRINHTHSLGFIAAAHNAAMEAKSPQHVFETLANADVLSSQSSMLDLVSITNVERAALWAYYGKTEMSSVCSQLLLLYNAGDRKQHIFIGETTCQAIVNVANILLESGEYRLARVVLDHAMHKFPNERSDKVWKLGDRIHEFTRLMRHGEVREAEMVAQEISCLDPLESLFRMVEVFLAKGDFPNALKFLKDIDEYPELSVKHKVRAGMLSTHIICISDLPCNIVPESHSIIHLNSVLEMATSNYLSYDVAIIKMHLASIQLLLKMPYRASKLVDEAIVTILAHGGLFDQGRAFVLHAKCLVATAPSAFSQTRNVVMLDAIKVLLKAKAAFQKTEAYGRTRSTLHLLCCLYHELDMKYDRNQCAFELRQLDQQNSVKSDLYSLF